MTREQLRESQMETREWEKSRGYEFWTSCVIYRGRKVQIQGTYQRIMPKPVSRRARRLMARKERLMSQ